MLIRPSLVSGTPVRARFVARPNRFVAICSLEDDSLVNAFMPNPGRMGELLLPDVTLLLEKATPSRERSTSFTVAGIFQQDTVIGLNTLRANGIAEYLIERKLIPVLERSRIIRSEVNFGNSRFDFLVESTERNRAFLEVKSVTLHGQGVAMFPDGVTDRGSRHLLELADLSRRGAMSIVLFLVQGGGQDIFMPDYHVDFEFAKNMLQTRGNINFVPVAVEWDSNLMLRDQVRALQIPWDFLSKQVVDKGAYLLILRMDAASTVQIGSLGPVGTRVGYYIYVGSGMNGLSRRIARHLRKRKNFRWHIDYLRSVAVHVQAFAIRSPRPIEFDLAEAVARIYQEAQIGFGSADSPHATHLFFSETDPRAQEVFYRLLEEFRFVRP